MADSLLLLALLVAAYVGFALLALSQAQHWRAVVGAVALPRRRVRGLRSIGGTSIALSLILALMRDGSSFGSLLWATAISVAALAVAFTLAWRPRLLRPLAVLGRGLGRSFRRRAVS